MRALLTLLVLSACASTPNAPHVPVDPPKALDTVAPAAISAAADLDAAGLVAKARAFFDSVDHFDTASVADLISPTFTFFAEQRFSDGPVFAKTLGNRKERHLPVRSRSYAEEKTYLGTNTSIYIGHTTEHIPSDGERPASDLEGWDTLVWTRERDRWQVAHWGWQVAGLEVERAMWDQTFKGSLGFNLKPNQLLVDTVKGKKPGTALDIAMGQGRNAVFLATQGWKVTGIDISEQGMRMAREAAAAKKVKLETITADMTTYDPGRDRWDLITMIYAGVNHDIIERAKLGLRKNGLFVVEYFAHGAFPSNPEGFAPGELAAMFKDGYKILADTEVEDTADWAGQRKTKLARFVAQKL